MKIESSIQHVQSQMIFFLFYNFGIEKYGEYFVKERDSCKNDFFNTKLYHFLLNLQWRKEFEVSNHSFFLLEA